MTDKNTQPREHADELREALRWALEWIDAVPQDTPLPTMPGFDRDYVNSLLTRQAAPEAPTPDVAHLRSLLADAWSYVKDGGGDTEAIDKALISTGAAPLVPEVAASEQQAIPSHAIVHDGVCYLPHIPTAATTASAPTWTQEQLDQIDREAEAMLTKFGTPRMLGDEATTASASGEACSVCAGNNLFCGHCEGMGTEPRKIIGYGECKCVLSRYCDGYCNPVFADEDRAALTQQSAAQAPTCNADSLIKAADAVVERWHSRDWKQPHTAEFIARLAEAVGAAKRGQGAAQAAHAGVDTELIAAVRKLVKAKGRFHTEQNYKALADALSNYDAAMSAATEQMEKP